MAAPHIRSTEMRCETLKGMIRENGLIEIKCNFIKCTKGKAVSVFHYFDPKTGELVDTKVFQDPAAKMRGRKR